MLHEIVDKFLMFHQTGRQTGRQTDRQADNQKDGHILKYGDCQICFF